MPIRRTYRINTDSWTVLRDILDNREDFNPDLSRRWVTRGMWSGYRYTGSFRGRNVNDPQNLYMGRLESPILDGHRAAGTVDYVVFSYETPIAYRISFYNHATGSIESEWFVPDVKYSVTTTKHQGKVRVALSQLDGYREDV